MTLTIEIFLYRDALSTHLSWATILSPPIARGADDRSHDQLLGLGSLAPSLSATGPPLGCADQVDERAQTGGKVATPGIVER